MSDTFITKRDSKLIAGVAILMMMVHHFFGIDSYLLPEVGYTELLTVRGISVERMFAAFGKLCVAIFAFSSGYAIWKMQGDYKSARGNFFRIAKFLMSYWVIMALFMVYGLICHDSLPTWKEAALNLVGLDTGPGMPFVNVSFAWYVAFYISLVALSPVFLWVFSTRRAAIDIAGYIAVASATFLCSGDLQSIVATMPAALTGMLVAKYRLFDRAGKLFSNHSPALPVMLLACLPLIRQGLLLIGKSGGGNSLVCRRLYRSYVHLSHTCTVAPR